MKWVAGTMFLNSIINLEKLIRCLFVWLVGGLYMYFFYCFSLVVAGQ